MNEIVMEGPGKNCLSTAMMDFLLLRLREASGGPLLLTGAGDAFCAGLDLRELSGLDGAGLEAYLRKLESLVETLYSYPGPTVAAVNGHAIAGGCVLALCCDQQVATLNPKTKIGLNELALGVRFPPITLSMLQDRIPKRHISTVIMGAGLFSPQRALHLGLVDELADNPVGVARERLAVLASHPPDSYSATKAALRGAAIDGSQSEHLFQQMLPAWTEPETRRRIAEAIKPKAK
jgi:enoyl-CoA hydratase